MNPQEQSQDLLLMQGEDDAQRASCASCAVHCTLHKLTEQHKTARVAIRPLAPETGGPLESDLLLVIFSSHNTLKQE